MSSSFIDQVRHTIQNEWPKALIGLVIPVTQYGWRLWQARQVETKKKHLREKIRELAQFIEVALPDGSGPARIKSDARKEYAEAVGKLAEITPREKKATPAIPSETDRKHAEASAKRGDTRAAETQAAAPIQSDVDKEYAEAVTKLAEITEQEAKSDIAPPSSRNWVRRWFLLYVPKRRLALIPQSIYFFLLLFTILAAVGILSDRKDPEFGSGLLGLAMFAGVTLLFRSWAVSLGEEPAKPGAPSKGSRRWIAVAVTVCVVFFEFVFLMAVGTDEEANFSRAAMRQNFVSIIVVSVIAGVIVAVAWRGRRRQS